MEKKKDRLPEGEWKTAKDETTTAVPHIYLKKQIRTCKKYYPGVSFCETGHTESTVDRIDPWWVR